ncbi:MAG: OST3/OST6 family protein [Candidatus Bathyarchaeota archaeon]|nr:OST3/OST6 family protein [Candidatus Bathyarchaeota archaeon]
MSRAVKKRVSSLSYSLNRFYRRISTARPSTLILSIITIAIAIFLFGGGLYNIIMKPLPAVYYGGRFIIIFPQLSEQFVSDSVVVTILYSLGVFGLLFMYQSTKYAYKPRQAYMMFIVGVILILLAYMFLEAIIRIKLSR